MKKTFSVAAILTLHSGYLLGKSEHEKAFNEMQQLMTFMMGELVYTHQIPRVQKFLVPFIEAQHPRITECDPTPFLHYQPVKYEHVKAAVDHAISILGAAELEIEAVPSGVPPSVDPIEELHNMVGKDRLIVVTSD